MNNRSLGKKTKYFFNLSLILLLFTGLLALSQGIHGRIDLTAEQRYTLSPSTKKQLDQLEHTLKIDAFLPLSTPISYQDLIAQWQNLLYDIQAQYDQSALTFYDTAGLDEQDEQTLLAFAEKLGVKPKKMVLQQADTRIEKSLPFAIVLSYLNQSIVLEPPETLSLLEFELNLALQSLITASAKPKLAFTQGHGETDFLKSPISLRLKQRAELQAIDLSQITETNEDELNQITALVIFAPQRAFTAQEVSRLSAYLKQGGNLLIAADYRVQSPEFPSIWVLRAYGLEPWLASLGIQIKNREVVADEQHPSLASLQRDAVGKASHIHHPLYIQTNQPKGFLKHFDALICPMCPPIEHTASQCQSLVHSFDTAQAYLDLRSLELNTAKAKRKAEVHGFDLITACEFEPGRLLVMGSANRFLSANPTQLMAFEDMIDWLLSLEELIPLKSKNDALPMLQQQSSQFRFYFKLSALLLPILFLIGLQLSFGLQRWRKYR